jgi:serine/threonine-protein kinase RsbT
MTEVAWAGLHPVRFYVGADADIAEAMRQARRLAEAIGFDRVSVSYIATVATELASNLFIHAGGGVFEALALGGDAGIKLVASDHGPGIADVDLAMQEGFSTAGGLGYGLPGIKRLMDQFQLESQPGQGTRVCVWKWK